MTESHLRKCNPHSLIRQIVLGLVAGILCFLVLSYSDSSARKDEPEVAAPTPANASLPEADPVSGAATTLIPPAEAGFSLPSAPEPIEGQADEVSSKLTPMLEMPVSGALPIATDAAEEPKPPMQMPAAPSAPLPVSKPATSSEPVSKPAPEPASKPASEPASKPAPEPASKLASEPASKPAPEPASKPASEPASKPASEPASKPAPAPESHGKELGKLSLTPASVLKQKSINHLSVQLMGASSLDAVEQFVHDNRLAGKVWVYQTSRNGSPWYVVLQGDHAGMSQAQAAIRQLPPALQKAEPWPKSFAQVNRELTP